MESDAILDALTHHKGLPVEAVRAAEAGAAMVPVFLDAIERYVASPEARAAPSPIFFIFHMLGSWREESACRPLARFLRCPTEDLDSELEYAVTEISHRVMIRKWR